MRNALVVQLFTGKEASPVGGNAPVITATRRVGMQFRYPPRTLASDRRALPDERGDQSDSCWDIYRQREYPALYPDADGSPPPSLRSPEESEASGQ